MKGPRTSAGTALMAVSDLGTARRFYEDQLGLVPGEQEQEGVRFFCAGEASVFVHLQPHNAGASSATLAGWTVDDLDETMDELRSRGVHFEHYVPRGSRRPGGSRGGLLVGS